MSLKHTTLILYLSLISSSTIFGQSYAWSFGIGNDQNDNESRIAIDEKSNMYSTGFFTGTVDFDPDAGTAKLTSGGSGTLANTYITKFDSSGTFVWAKQLTGDIYQYAKDIAFDPAGFIYVSGYYVGTCDFDPGPGQHNLTPPNNSFDSFLLKLDKDGNYVWAISVGGNGQEYAHRMTLDPDGNIILAGFFTGTSDFDPGPNQTIFTVSGQSDTYITKYSSDGNFIWARHTTGDFNSDVTGIVADENNNIYVTGAFDDNRNFNPEGDSMIIHATGFWDIYLQKLDPSGNLIWVRHLGNDNDNWPWDMVLDQKGYLYITGHFTGTLDFDPGPESDLHTSNLSDIYVLKLDLDGQFVWAVPLGGISYEQGKSIALDRSGGIYVTGFYAETIDFDPGPGIFNLTSTGDNDKDDAFVVKLHPDGSFAWAKTLGGLDDDIGYGVEIDSVDDIFLTGNFKATAGFNPGLQMTDSLISKGQSDVYYTRWRQCLESYGEISPFSCGPYYSPSGKYTWNESGTYLDTIQNKAGCDSILTINLSISDLGLTITQQGNTLIAGGGAKQFFWLDCDHDYAIVAEGPEFKPDADGNYALSGYGFVCTDTSACFAFMMTATSDVQDDKSFTLYPNPAKRTFYIDLGKQFSNIDVIIRDQTGRIVYEYNFIQSEIISIDKKLPAGVYFTSIIADRKTKLLKLIVQ